ncbi:MAG: hypothetical protein H6Q65_2736 [Firmicutes bacterium]|nr:hypothetical protein [Bacillota bacterium]
MLRSTFCKAMAGIIMAAMILGIGLPSVEAAKGTRVSAPAANRPAQQPAGGNANIDRGNIDNSNVRIGNDTNINIDVDGRYGYPVRVPPAGYYDYDHHHYGYSDEQVVGAFIAGLVIGAILTEEPANTTTVVVKETEYLYDGTNYYQPVYDGTTVVYKVVENPT